MWMLLHGFTGAPSSWEPVLAAGDFAGPTVAPFLAGHGPEWRCKSGSTFVDEVDRLAELASQMDRPRFLAGYSLGARVALVLLAEHLLLEKDGPAAAGIPAGRHPAVGGFRAHDVPTIPRSAASEPMNTWTPSASSVCSRSCRSFCFSSKALR